MCVYVVKRDDGTSLMLLGNYKKKCSCLIVSQTLPLPWSRKTFDVLKIHDS